MGLKEFACKKCGHGFGYYTTGQKRLRTGKGYEYQYRCVQCGGLGWSKHPDVVAKYNRDKTENEAKL